VDADRLQREIDLEKQRAIESGKPAEMAEKIAQGRVNKEFLQQVVLLEQPWYADLSKKVGEVIGGVKVVRIVRLEAGKAPVDSSLG
jgi:elongation factor Ts